MASSDVVDRRRELLAEFGSAVLERQDLPSFFRQAVVSIADVFDVEMCKILEKLPMESDGLLLRAGVGWKDGLVGRAMVGIGSDSQAGHTLQSPEPVVVEDLTTETRFDGPPLLHEHGVISGLSTVIGRFDSPYGVLGLHSTRHRRFTREDIVLVQSLANLLATAIELERSNKAFLLQQRAIESARNGIIITDPRQPDNPIIFVNRAFEVITGYSRQEVLGKNCRFLQKDGHRNQSALNELRVALAEGRELRVELLNARKDGREFWLELFVSPIREDDGTLTHFIGVQNDITERKRLEEQMLQAQKMEAVGQLAGGVAHDFNTLLGTIQGYSEMLLEDLPTDTSLRSPVEEIHRCALRGAGLTRQLLTFSRSHNAQPEILCLYSVVKEMESMLRRLIGEDVELVFALTPHSANISADRGQVEQIVMNLVVNAADAMPEGGRLTLSTECGSSPPETEPSWIGLSIADTGCGMSEETRQRLFEPFYTTKEPGKGTGLGLSTVYGIVHEAGGGIDVESELGRGTKFMVRFPAILQETVGQEVAMTAASSPMTRGSETIFLVEDDKMFRELLTQILKRNGYEVVAAADPTQAIARREQHAGSIDLLISDMVMPGGTGSELAVHFMERYPALEVLLMSGYTDDALAKRNVPELESAEFIPKPFSTTELLLRVREILSNRDANPSGQSAPPRQARS